jgi:peptidyl-dipeptidase Dcp
LTEANPLDRPWTTPHGAPPFASIRTEHFRPAIDKALATNLAEIDAIASSPESPTFANTIEAMERSGEDLNRVGGVLWNLTGTMSDDPLRAIERELAPVMSRHRSAIRLNPKLFARIDAVFRGRESAGLNAEQLRLVERVHKSFTRGGAALDDAGRARLAAINERLATLGTHFSQNVLKDESDFILLLETEADLAGLSPDFISSAAALAEERGHAGKHAVSLSRGTVETFLTDSTRRDLREKLMEAFLMRGQNGGETDNRAIIAETLKLRGERARLLGYKTYADFKLDDTMASDTATVYDLLDKVWTPGRAQSLRERDRLQEMIKSEGGNFALAPHDWRHYSERLRKADFDIDDAELRPYFPLDRVIEASFFVANKLFGLTFNERKDIGTYHPDVRVFEAKDADGKHAALFFGDYFARASKRGGAWMSAFRSQRKLGGDQRPIIVNVLNIAKPAEGAPALLSITEAATLFHEFGHALHGMLSNVTYPSLAGTAVSTDFVELPSQLYEHWLLTRDVLSRFARHVETDEPLPDAMIERVRAAQKFNQGFGTVEFCSSAYVDMDAHMANDVGDPLDLESKTLGRIQNPAEIPMRHRSPQFGHIYSGEGYASGYYSYLWSATLDQDAFAAFEETGDVFDGPTAKRLRDYIYSAGNLRDPKEAYVAFRGRLPSVEPLLKSRGFA